MSGPDATATAGAIARHEVSAVDVVTATLERIASTDGTLNAFTVVCAHAAMAQAAEVDAGRRSGPLAGVPISVKDHVWVAGLPATNGSRALADFVPDETCVAVQRLVDAGAIIVGKTNNPEFCYRGVTDNDLHGATANPHDPSRTAGGSSGGAACSVAAGMVPLAVGTDGGGSIRIPSAFCGTYGLKPTFGLVPTMPGFRGWPSLSVTGPIAGSVRDLRLALAVMAGPDLPGRSSSSGPTPRADQAWKGVRVAVSVDLGFAELDPDVREAFRATIDRISDAGAQLIEAHPDPVDPTDLWDRIAAAEGYASEGPLVEAHPDLIGADAAAITLSGRATSARAYLDAQFERDSYVQSWDRFFDGIDLLLTPTMPVSAFPLGQLAPTSIDGRAVPPSFDAWCALALPANLARLPAATVPVGGAALPVGVQIMGARSADALVLSGAAAVTAVSDFFAGPSAFADIQPCS